ncbi:hypothetical protein WN943_018871 [Citrus x changshan-huyou]
MFRVHVVFLGHPLLEGFQMTFPFFLFIFGFHLRLFKYYKVAVMFWFFISFLQIFVAMMLECL